MTIGIVLHPYGEKEPAGLGQAIFELAKAMIAASPEHEFLIFIKGDPERRPEFPGTNWRVHPLGGGIFWLDRLHKAPPADVYLFNTPVLPHFWRRKSVVVALDFAYLHLPAHGAGERIKRYLLKRRHRAALHRASRVAAISEATRQDAIRYFGLPPERVKTIYLGYNRICSVPSQPLSLPEKFFLFVGVLKARKNVHTIIKSFARFHPRHPDFHLLLAGRAEGEYAAAMRAMVRKEGLEGHVHFLGYRSDAQLAYLYQRTAALVYTSVVEGFGFPILEAMNCGTPVITSATSSLPELAGDAAFLVDPQDPAALAAAMERIARDPVFVETLIKRGMEQAKKFSWDKAGRETAVVLRRAAMS